MSTVYALVDCNAFYCSCERVFDPRLLKVPVVVLSNNDGCVVARTQEAKDAGVKMGVPYFQARPLLKQIGAVARSSNYTLYADMSARIQDVLRAYDFEMEVYSIDECFLRFNGFSDYPALAREIKARVFRCTGIPVGVGIAPTKSLAKIANKLAKKRGGICILLDDEIDTALADFPVPDMWGIGRQYATFLIANGIKYALDLKRADDRWIQDNLTIVGLRIAHELRGIQCIELEDAPPPKKNLTCSRMFSRPVTNQRELDEALSVYAERVAQKLRKGQQLASIVHTFILTNPFKEPHYSGGTAVRLAVASASTIEILAAVRAGLRKVYRPGLAYTKAGVILDELTPNTITQPDLFAQDNLGRDARIMGAVDAINKAWGTDCLRLASSGTRRGWSMKRGLLSPSYTTQWDDIMRVR